jgi:hypothetical protein
MAVASANVGSAKDREDERRESPRVAARFQVQELTAGGTLKERTGNISLGGVFWQTEDQPLSALVEIRLQPEPEIEVRAVGEVIRVREIGTEFGVHVRFSEVALDHELRLARFLHAQVAQSCE